MDMKWILGMLLVLMLVACAPQEAPEDTKPADQAGDTADTTVEAPADTGAEDAAADIEAPADEEVPDLGLTETKNAGLLDPATAERWKASCLAGNAGLCAALERYGIDPNANAMATEENIDQQASEPDTAEEGVEMVEPEE